MAAKKSERVVNAEVELFRRLNIKVTESAYERLLLHSIKAKSDPGKLVTRLIDNHLREWKISPNVTAPIVAKGRHDLAASTRDSDAA